MQVVHQNDGWELIDIEAKHALLNKGDVWRIAKVLRYIGLFSVIFVDSFPPMSENDAMDRYTLPL